MDDVGPALQLVRENLQSGCQGPGKYQMLTEKQCSEAKDQEFWGSKRRAPALEGRGKPDQETRAQVLSCLIHMGTPHLSIVFKAFHYPSDKNTCLNCQ